ncbi:acyl-CoA dehydrogenase [Actinocatenispora rupis]|uniref:Broad-specificity linear acyl-CoA dehydrogenase FadE5 n=1 Tax=Actinocatenispora rupis TaxID=519421 RepID=A0A8J3JC83_9ACTN|nr:acyl-CoA dehydrogenase [Actinocatenispora rupis]GID13333.1 acyl-CoA dehydrogenase [Actinocatenispora rupis]
MGHYKSNLRDLEFNLFEVFGTADRLAKPPFEEIDEDTARGLLAEIDRFAREELATSYADADRNPPVFDPATHTVKLPESFRKPFLAMMDAEYWRMDIPEEMGGTSAPRALWWSAAEMILGANPAAFMYAAGPSFAGALYADGTDEQRAWAKLFTEKRWGATMVLTEPDAGSDVGAGRTKAYKQEDGTWRIEGVKRFITSGEHDLSENIIHYVLARPVGVEGAGGPGTKGLSLFVVPKFRFDPETGELGERNGAYVTNVEHKMGLKVSTTCELTLGDGEPCVGYLVGDVHDGIRQMFHIIEYARMFVGTKAMSALSTGYLNALEYAKSRVQGADLTNPSKSAPRVTITHHPDVRRSLLMQKSYAEGLRALVAYTANWQDAVKIAVATGDADAEELAKRVNDLLLPLVKGCGSERAYELLGSESLQTFGGSGFLQDYPIEQYIRDSKIDTLYEGTTAIQSQDLFFRKIVKDQGNALLAVAGEIKAFVDAEGGDEQLKVVRAAVGTALDNVQGILGKIFEYAGAAQQGEPRSIYKAALHLRRLLLAMGDLVIGWLLARQAEVALAKLAGEVSDDDRLFYTGKVAAASFFAAEVLPRLASDKAIVEGANLDAMDLPEAAF